MLICITCISKSKLVNKSHHMCSDDNRLHDSQKFFCEKYIYMNKILITGSIEKEKKICQVIVAYLMVFHYGALTTLGSTPTQLVCWTSQGLLADMSDFFPREKLYVLGTICD